MEEFKVVKYVFGFLSDAELPDVLVKVAKEDF
jgi:hypothetical protein